MEAKTDAELVELARRVDRTAYDELIRRHQRPIFALACIPISDRFEAEDLTQEAFLRAWLNLDLLSDPAKFAPWLRRIIFGVCIDWLRTFDRISIAFRIPRLNRRCSKRRRRPNPF